MPRLPLILFALMAAASAAEPLGIPRLDGVRIDGRGDDWGGGGFRLDALSPLPDRGELPTVLPPAADLDLRLRLAWDARGLLVLARWRDDRPVEAASRGGLYEGDSLELFLAADAAGGQLFQPVIAPGLDPAWPEPRCFVHQAGGRAIACPLAVRREEGGCTLEALLPWSAFAAPPGAGAVVGFRALVNDRDGEGMRQRRGWQLPGQAPGRGLWPLRLADAPSPAVERAAGVGVERWRRLRVLVQAEPAAAGQTVEAVLGAASATAVLAADAEGGRSVASLALPLPPPGRAAQVAPGVLVGGRALPCADLGDLDARRRALAAEVELDSPAWVFSGAAIPPCTVRDPAALEDLIGPFTVRRRCFAADHREVAAAAAPGRHGALVEVVDGAGTVAAVRQATFFRCAAPPPELEDELLFQWPWPGADGARLPPWLGLAPDPAAGPQLARLLPRALLRGAEGARILAAAAEGRAAAPAAADRDWWYRQRKALGLTAPLRRVEALPAGYDADPARRWPLIVYLHGAGGGRDQAQMERDGLMALARRQDLGAVVVAPANPNDRRPRLEARWIAAELGDFLDAYLAERRIDPARITLTGFSRGAFGTWEWAAAQPARFAAIAPVAGVGDPATAPLLAGLPVWMLLGEQDAIASPAQAQAMEDALRAAGSAVRHTRLEGADHPGTQARAYGDDALARWLAGQRRP